MPTERRTLLPFDLTLSGFRMSLSEYDVIRDDLNEIELPGEVSDELSLALNGAIVASRNRVILPDKSIPLLANYYLVCATYASEHQLPSLAQDLRCSQELTRLAIELDLLPEQ